MKTKYTHMWTEYEWLDHMIEEAERIVKCYEPDGDLMKCRRCGTHITSLTEKHRIMCGGVETNLIYRYHRPYCKKCDKKPKLDGRPINLFIETDIAMFCAKTARG